MWMGVEAGAEFFLIGRFCKDAVEWRENIGDPFWAIVHLVLQHDVNPDEIHPSNGFSTLKICRKMLDVGNVGQRQSFIAKWAFLTECRLAGKPALVNQGLWVEGGHHPPP